MAFDRDRAVYALVLPKAKAQAAEHGVDLIEGELYREVAEIVSGIHRMCSLKNTAAKVLTALELGP